MMRVSNNARSLLAVLTIAVAALFLICSTARAQEEVTFCISGIVAHAAGNPDPLGLGEGSHDFTASITIGPADIQDVNFAIDRAEYRSDVFEVAIDGVPLPRGDFPGAIGFRDRVDSATDLVLMFLRFQDDQGNTYSLGLSANVSPETFSFSHHYEPFVPFPTTTIVSTISDALAGANWIVPAGEPLVVSSQGCDPPTVMELIESAAELTAQINLDNGLANSLDSKLENVLDAWIAENAENRQDVVNKLMSFVNSVEAQRGKKITDAEADELVAVALEIVELIL